MNNPEMELVNFKFVFSRICLVHCLPSTIIFILNMNVLYTSCHLPDSSSETKGLNDF